MSLMLIVNLRLCRLDKLLKFGNLEFEEVNCKRTYGDAGTGDPMGSWGARQPSRV